jgi:hypothetical protein
MGIALGIIGMLATIAGIVLLIIALVKKKGWGVARSLAILAVGIILFLWVSSQLLHRRVSLLQLLQKHHQLKSYKYLAIV